jgi:membrane protein
MARVREVTKRTLKSFYDDQMTHHAAALTYYSLMSLFPAVLMGVSLLGLLGQYPQTYDAIIGYLRDVAPDSTVAALDATLRSAFRSKGLAATTLAIGAIIALYGATGVLEAARRAMNVSFGVEGGRGFLQRKKTDLISSLVLGSLVLLTLILVFVGGDFAADLLGFIGLGSTAADVWAIARWPAAGLAAMLAFSWIYYVTPDVRHRGFRWVTPGAAAGVLLWLLASAGFSVYVSNVGNLNATYGSFATAIVLVFWLWLTNIALLFGAELNAEIEREKELAEGVPAAETLRLPEKG